MKQQLEKSPESSLSDSSIMNSLNLLSDKITQKLAHVA